MGNAIVVPDGTRTKCIEVRSELGYAIQRCLPHSAQPYQLSTPASLISHLFNPYAIHGGYSEDAHSSTGTMHDTAFVHECTKTCGASPETDSNEFRETHLYISESIQSSGHDVMEEKEVDLSAHGTESIVAPETLIAWLIQANQDGNLIVELITNPIATSDLMSQGTVLLLHTSPTSSNTFQPSLQPSGKEQSRALASPVQALELLKLLGQRLDYSTRSGHSTNTSAGASSQRGTATVGPELILHFRDFILSLYHWPNKHSSPEVQHYVHWTFSHFAHVFHQNHDTKHKFLMLLEQGSYASKGARGFVPLGLSVPVPVPPPAAFGFGGSTASLATRSPSSTPSPQAASTVSHDAKDMTSGQHPISSSAQRFWKSSGTGRSATPDPDSVVSSLRALVSDTSPRPGPFSRCPIIHEFVNHILDNFGSRTATPVVQDDNSKHDSFQIPLGSPRNDSRRSSRTTSEGQSNVSEAPLQLEAAPFSSIVSNAVAEHPAASTYDSPSVTQPVPIQRTHVRTPSVTLDLSLLGGTAIEAPSEFDEHSQHMPWKAPTVPSSRPVSALGNISRAASQLSTPTVSLQPKFLYAAPSGEGQLSTLDLPTSSPSTSVVSPSNSSSSSSAKTVTTLRMSPRTGAPSQLHAESTVPRGASNEIATRGVSLDLSAFASEPDIEEEEGEEEDEMDSATLAAELCCGMPPSPTSDISVETSQETVVIPFLQRGVDIATRESLLNSRIPLDPEVVRAERLFRSAEIPSSTTSAASSSSSTYMRETGRGTARGVNQAGWATANSNPAYSGFIANDDEEEMLMRKNRKLAFYSQRCTQLLPFLFISGRTVSQSKDMLQAYGITHIVNCASTVCKNVFEGVRDPYGDGSVEYIDYLSLPMLDSTHEDLFAIFYQVIRYILRVREENPSGRILVHCQQGVSRSSAICIGFLMLWFRMSYEAACGYVKRRRGICSPNVGFMCQLMAWFQRLCSSFQLTPPLRFGEDSDQLVPLPALLYRISYSSPGKTIGLTHGSTTHSRRPSSALLHRLPSFRLVDFADPLVEILQRLQAGDQEDLDIRSSVVPLHALLDPRTSYLLCLPNLSLIALSQSDPRPELLALHLLSLIEYEGASPTVGCLFLPPEGEESGPECTLPVSRISADDLTALLKAHPLVSEGCATSSQIRVLSASQAEAHFWSFMKCAGITNAPQSANGPFYHGIVEMPSSSVGDSSASIAYPSVLPKQPLYDDEVKPFCALGSLEGLPQDVRLEQLRTLSDNLMQHVIVPVLTSPAVAVDSEPDIPTQDLDSSTHSETRSIWNASRALDVALCREFVDSHSFGAYVHADAHQAVAVIDLTESIEHMQEAEIKNAILDSSRMDHSHIQECDLGDEQVDTEEEPDVIQRRKLKALFGAAVQLYELGQWQEPLDPFESQDLVDDGIFLLHRNRSEWKRFVDFVGSCDPDTCEEFILCFDDEDLQDCERDAGSHEASGPESEQHYVHDLFIWVGKDCNVAADEEQFESVLHGIATEFCTEFSISLEQCRIRCEYQNQESETFWQCFING